MPFEKAVQSLNVLEEKLRRAFGLAGPIGARLDAVLSPVLIAGDLREPGHSSSVGRCWTVGSRSLAFGANAYWSVQFDVDVVVDAFTITGNPADSFDVYTTVSGQLSAQVIAVANGSWRDRRILTTDLPPIRSAAAAGGLQVGGTVEANGNRIWAGRVGSQYVVTPLSMMLPAGSAINVHAVAGSGDASFFCWGRIW